MDSASRVAPLAGMRLEAALEDPLIKEVVRMMAGMSEAEKQFVLNAIDTLMVGKR